MFYFLDLLLYGFAIGVIVVFAKIFPWAAVSMVLGFYPGADLILGVKLLKNILTGAIIMVGISVLAGILSKNKFVFTKNASFPEKIGISKQEKYKDIAWQIAESFLCFLAVILISQIGEHFLQGHSFILFVTKFVLAYITIMFRLKRNRAINDSVYEAKRQEIQQQQEEIRQQQLAQQEKLRQQQLAQQQELRQRQEEMNRQLQIDTENREKGLRKREEQFQRDRDIFTDFIIRECGFPECVRQIFTGKYRTYDLAKFAKENETWSFNCGDLGVQIHRGEVGTIWITNSDKISEIERIIIGSGLFGDIQSDPYKGDTSHLMALSESGDPLSFIGKAYTAQAKRQSLGPLYSRIGEFTARRYAEFNDLIRLRVQYYLGEYRGMKAGEVGEKAVEEILDLHRGSFLVIHNLRLEFPNKAGKADSVETDTFVMAPYGLFAIETKNYGASGKYRLVVTGDGNWYKEYPSRDPNEPAKRERMQNPYEQNDRHIAFLERFINELLGREMMDYVHIKNIIVLGNDNVEIINDPAAKQTLTRVGNLYNQLTQDTTPRFTLDELHRIEKALLEKNLPPKKYPMNDYREEIRGMVEAYKGLLKLPAQMKTAESKYCQNVNSQKSKAQPDSE